MEIPWVIAVAFLAALTQSTVGFGFSLLFVPFAAVVVGAHDAVATSILGGTAISWMLYAEHRPRAPLRAVWPLVIAAIAGAPAGVALLLAMDEEMLEILVGAVVLASALVNLLTRGDSVAGTVRVRSLPTMLAAGFASGILRGAVSFPGPPVILYEHWVGGTAERIRSHMFAFFAFMALPTALIAAAGGVFGREVLIWAASALPAVAGGVAAGRLLRPRLSEHWFGRLSMLLLAGASLTSISGAIAR